MEDDAVDYVRQILEALKFMHERHIVHLDLKVTSTSLSVLAIRLYQDKKKNDNSCGSREYITIELHYHHYLTLFNTQLFRNGLSFKSVKAYATMLLD